MLIFNFLKSIRSGYKWYACKQFSLFGGIFVNSQFLKYRSYLFAIIGAEYVLDLLPRGTHDYQKFIKPSELNRWVRDADLEVKETVGLSYNPLTDYYWLGKNLKVNYMVHVR